MFIVLGYSFLIVNCQFNHRPYRHSDLHQATAIGFAVVAVQLADVRTVGNHLGVRLHMMAHLPGRTVVVTDQAGEIEKRIFPRVVPAELQRITRSFDRHLPAMPISVLAP